MQLSGTGRLTSNVLARSREGNLYLVTIPLEPEGLDALADRDYLELELTKETRVYRSYPDPVYYSEHERQMTITGYGNLKPGQHLQFSPIL